MLICTCVVTYGLHFVIECNIRCPSSFSFSDRLSFTQGTSDQFSIGLIRATLDESFPLGSVGCDSCASEGSFTPNAMQLSMQTMDSCGALHNVRFVDSLTL